MFKTIKYRSVDKHHTGNIHVIEGSKKIKFNIKRIYFINNIQDKHTRPGHAHKNLNQIINCISGSIKMKIFDGNKEETIILNDPKKAIFLENGLWRDITFLKKNTILLVICSDIYRKSDYIRSKKKFIAWKKSNT